MKWLLLVSLCVVLTAYETAGQIHCYSCSSSFGSRYGRRNYNCVRNLTAIRTVRCSRGYYCLTSYTVQNGIVTSIRRTCQNPRYDHNQNTNEAPTENGCVSSHSRYSSPDSVTCYFHCQTDRCNKDTPSSVKQCPNECPNTCDLLTGSCSTTLSCVQCTSESDKSCETKTDATPCPRSSYNYCAATRTSVLNLQSRIVNTAVTKTCTRFSSSYSLPTQTCRFRTNSRSRSNNRLVTYACSNFCTSNGCNIKIPGGTPIKSTGSSLRCVVCTQIGSRGSCARTRFSRQCPSSATHCKATVIYYQSPYQTSSGRPVYQLANVTRECATGPVTRGCTTTSVPNSNLQQVFCQETCQTNGCNSGWPARPKCSQCDVRNRTYTRNQFERCRANPYQPRQCPSPLYQYCTTGSNNTLSNAGFPRIVRRGCSITDIGTRCFDIPAAGGTTLRHCQTTCKTDGCNERGTL